MKSHRSQSLEKPDGEDSRYLVDNPKIEEFDALRKEAEAEGIEKWRSHEVKHYRK